MERPGVDAQQRGVTGGHRIRAHEAERVAQAELDRLRRRRRVDELAVAPHLALAEQRERDLRQPGRSPVPSDPSSRVSGVTPALSARDEAVEQRRRRAGAAGAELVGAHDHARPDQLRCERPACADGVAAQQVPLEALAVGVADRPVAERADAGGGAVQSLASLEQRRDRARARRRCARGPRGRARRARPRRATGVDRVRRERRAIEHDRRRG